MAWEDTFHNIPTLEASADLSSDQRRFVVLSSGQVAAAGAGVRAIGVLRNAPDAAGKAAEVQDMGVARVQCGGSVSQGDDLTPNGDGDAVTAGSGDHIVAEALEAGASGEVISALLIYKGTG